MGALYQIQFPNGKSYIGITNTTVARRFRQHQYNTTSGAADRAVNRALKKYGQDVTCRELVRGSWEYVLALEPKAIAAYATFGRGGYNMTAGGEGAIGYKHTAESLRKMSAAHANNAGRKYGSVKHTLEARQKMSAAQKGRKLTPEQIENIRKSLLGNTRLLGTKQSDEHLKNRIVGLLKSAKGVSFDKKNDKWRAYICIGGAMQHLGRFTTEAEALTARENAVATALRRLA